MAALADEKLYTKDYIEALPEGRRAELIDGAIYDMAAPSMTHQSILMYVSSSLHEYIKSHGGKCKVFPAPFAVYLDNDDYTYLEPDISVVCDPSKLDEKGCHGAPDLIVEIVSPTSKTMDYLRKFSKYRAAGVREYWIVNPEREAVNVYRFGDRDAEEADVYGFNNEVPVGIYPELAVRISEAL